MQLKKTNGYNRIGVIVLMVFVVAVVAGVLYWNCSRDVSQKQKTATVYQIDTDLRLRWLIQSQFAGIYWADKKKIFQEEGISLTIKPGGPGINFMQLVGSGAEDFGICAAPQIIEARAKGVPVVALAVIFQANPVVFFSKKDSGINTPADWTGKTVAVFHGYEQETVYRAIVLKNGLDPKQITEYPAQMDMSPFFRDAVDVWSGYVINQPNTAEEKGFPVTRIFPDDYGVHLSGDTLFTTEKVIKEKPELVQHMVNAVLSGWKDALANKEESINIILSLDTKLDRIHETKMIDWVEKLTLTKEIEGKIGCMTDKQWQDMIDLWKQFGGITADIKSGDCYNLTFIDNYYEKNQN